MCLLIREQTETFNTKLVFFVTRLLPSQASSLQRDIVGSNEHLTGAVIPVQDLHLTLFVLTLNEQDGTLQVRTYQ